MWYESNPERWKREQDSLTAKNISFTIDEKARQNGFIRLTVFITKESAIEDIPAKFLPLELTVVYPQDFPFFRPDVYAAGISLPRHQNPLQKNLCLLPRGSGFWLPETAIGEHLSEQLPKALTAGEIVEPSVLSNIPNEQGEPVSEFYPVYVNAPVTIDTSGFDKLPPAEGPVACLGRFTAGFPEGAVLPSRIFALECFDAAGSTISELPVHTRNLFPARGGGYIYRISERPPFGDPEKDYQWFIDLLKEHNVALMKPKISITLKNKGYIDQIIGLTFPEEHTAGKQSPGWLFMIRVTYPKVVVVGKKNINAPAKSAYYTRANRINMDELTFRNPSLKSLANKKIVIFGLGALGGPSAIAFAKNNIGELRLVDFDTVTAGTIVRWPLGLSAAGMFKTEALTDFIQKNYPYTNVMAFNHRIGANNSGPTATAINAEDPNIFMDRVLDQADLIYDATAESGVSHFLSEEAKKRKIPFLSVYGKPGVWGGVVMRVVPGLTKGCWMCFQYALERGDISNPPTNVNSNIQAAGCGDISFSGTSFELDNLISAGVRMAVSTLSSPEGGYPDLNGDIGVLALVDDHGNPIFPRWSAYPLSIHPECPYCNPQK